jgi:hypothetical protein
MIAVHDENASGFSAATRVNELISLFGKLNHAPYGSGVGYDNRQDPFAGNEIPQSDVDQSHSYLPYSIF